MKRLSVFVFFIFSRRSLYHHMLCRRFKTTSVGPYLFKRGASLLWNYQTLLGFLLLSFIICWICEDWKLWRPYRVVEEWVISLPSYNHRVHTSSSHSKLLRICVSLPQKNIITSKRMVGIRTIVQCANSAGFPRHVHTSLRKLTGNNSTSLAFKAPPYHFL